MKYTDGRRRTRLFRQGRNRGPLVPISLIIIAILLAAFSLIKPFQFSTNLNINPANVVVPTWTPTPTPLPTPTDVHGGHIVFTEWGMAPELPAGATVGTLEAHRWRRSRSSALG